MLHTRPGHCLLEKLSGLQAGGVFYTFTQGVLFGIGMCGIVRSDATESIRVEKEAATAGVFVPQMSLCSP